MIRAILSVVAGLLAWAVVATGLDRILRVALDGYAIAEPTFHFTLPMMIARLSLPGALPSVCAGFACAWVSRGNPRATAALVVVLLAVFVPVHYRLWAQLPPWFHLTFLASLVLLTVLGARLRRSATP